VAGQVRLVEWSRPAEHLDLSDLRLGAMQKPGLMRRKDGDGDDGQNPDDADEEVDLSPSPLRTASPLSL
jgi:hypothetical protein